MDRQEVENNIRGCAEFFKERYGNMKFKCWLCKETVHKCCGGIEFIEATINQYIGDDEPVDAPEPKQSEPILITEQLSFF